MYSTLLIIQPFLEIFPLYILTDLHNPRIGDMEIGVGDIHCVHFNISLRCGNWLQTKNGVRFSQWSCIVENDYQNSWCARNFCRLWDFSGQIYIAKGERVQWYTFLNYISTYFSSTSDMCTLKIYLGGFDTFFFWYTSQHSHC